MLKRKDIEGMFEGWELNRDAIYHVDRVEKKVYYVYVDRSSFRDGTPNLDGKAWVGYKQAFLLRDLSWWDRRTIHQEYRREVKRRTEKAIIGMVMDVGITKIQK